MKITEFHSHGKNTIRAGFADNAAALNRFLHHKANIDALLAEIATASANHFDTMPDAINYGHVGTLAYIHTRLGEIANMIAGGGEYAE